MTSKKIKKSELALIFEEMGAPATLLSCNDRQLCEIREWITELIHTHGRNQSDEIDSLFYSEDECRQTYDEPTIEA